MQFQKVKPCPDNTGRKPLVGGAEEQFHVSESYFPFPSNIGMYLNIVKSCNFCVC